MFLEIHWDPEKVSTYLELNDDGVTVTANSKSNSIWRTIIANTCFTTGAFISVVTNY